jgi:Ca2+-binding RTX toxin-like protein
LVAEQKLEPNIPDICCFSIPVEASGPVATANPRRNFTLAIISGTNASEVLTGGSESDFINGFGGDDFLLGNSGNDALHGGDGNDSLSGSEGDDFLFGDSGIDRLVGGAGIDLLVGGIGFDKLTGDTEADTFRYLSTADSGVGSLGSFRRDVITDFVHGQDKIDLEAIDAKAGIVDNQNFVFIGSAPFSAEGQVRVVTDGDHMLVQMNTSGTSGAESVIELTGNINVTATDFVL